MNNQDDSYLIKATDICLHIADRSVLDHVDLEVKAGEIVTLIGPNGSGKTSLVRLLLGLIKSDKGQLLRKADLRVGYLPQKIHVDPILPLNVKRFLQLACPVTDEQLITAVKQLSVEHLLTSPIQKISGGEFQRVLLARALLRKPDLLVLDEPAQGVDINGQQQLYRLISEIRDQYGCGVLMVSHDLNLVMASTDRVLCLNTHICCTGHPEAVSKHPEYLKLFGASLDDMAVYTHHHDHTHNLSGDIVEHKDCDHG